MNKEEFIGKLQMVYVGDKRASEEIISEYDRLNNIINELEKDLWEVRQLTFTKYNSNEWNNCLSFNEDIKPILDKLKELKENNNV